MDLGTFREITKNLSDDTILCGDKEIILKELTKVVLQANDEMPENLLGTKAYYFDPEHGFEF